jgi:hypothetical protein
MLIVAMLKVASKYAECNYAECHSPNAVILCHDFVVLKDMPELRHTFLLH